MASSYLGVCVMMFNHFKFHELVYQDHTRGHKMIQVV